MKTEFTDGDFVRFWAKVSLGDSAQCWPWNGAKANWGYGSFNLNRRSVRSNRFAWVSTLGPIANSLWVLHKCDNPGCCNPHHLFLGTPKDNVQDMIRKGRRAVAVPKGSKNSGSKLTEQVVHELRKRYLSGKLGRQRDEAKRLGVHQSTLFEAISGKTWRHC